MDEQILKWLQDVYDSISSIESYLGESRDFNNYQKNKMLRRAVEREFEIIGEAMNRVEKKDNSLAITAKERIIGMRNWVIHSYDNVDNQVIWGTIIRHLPKLKQEVKAILDENP